MHHAVTENPTRNIDAEIKLRSCLEVADSKEKIIKLLEENTTLKDEKMTYLQSNIKQLEKELERLKSR